MRRLVYLVGPPAAGKSTLMHHLTYSCSAQPEMVPVPHRVLRRHDRTVAAEIGVKRTVFSGTDALAMNIQPMACNAVAEGFFTAPLLLAEGDRLATMGFLSAAAEAGFTPTLLALFARHETLDARCAIRGSAQSKAWRAGRETKVHRLIANAENAGWPVWMLDGDQHEQHVLADALVLVPELQELM